MRVAFLDGYLNEQLLLNRHILDEKKCDAFTEDLMKALDEVLFFRLKNTNTV